MIFKGKPNFLVRITKPKKGEVKHFTTDSEGLYETMHPTTITRLKCSPEFNIVSENELKPIDDMTYEELKKEATKSEIKWFGIKKEKLIELLKEVK